MRKHPSLLDRMENSTIQALERQVDHLNKRIDELEAEREKQAELIRLDSQHILEWQDGYEHEKARAEKAEAAYRKGLSGHPEGCICVDHETIRNLKAEVERLRKEIQKGIDAGYINADWEIAAASPAAPDTSGEASPTRVASPPLPLPKADDCIHEVCAGTWLRTADMATLPCPCECHAAASPAAPSGVSPATPLMTIRKCGAPGCQGHLEYAARKERGPAPEGGSDAKRGA